jgi:hypothetical protein
VNPYNYEILNFYNKHLKTSERGRPKKKPSSLTGTLDKLNENNETHFSRHELQKVLAEHGPLNPDGSLPTRE